ncbi:MAG: hypothetical protein ACHQ06_01410 [Candidatus Dormibacteria bacterium]
MFTGQVCFAGLVAAAVACGAAVAALLSLFIDPNLHVSTDIIGYATFHAFNPSVYAEKYQLVVVVFPLVSLTTFFLMLLVWRWRQLPLPAFANGGARSIAAPDTNADTSPSRTDTLAMPLVRSLGVGATLGLILAIARDDGGVGAWRDVIFLAAAYAMVVWAASALLARPPSEPERGRHVRLQMSRLNAAGAAGALLGLPVASLATQVTVMSDGTVHHYAWLPVWLGAVVIVAALIIVAITLFRAGTDVAAATRIERRVIFLVTLPVALFLALAVASGALPIFLSFEDGQALTTLRLVESGGFPWRDWISTHGILEDAFASLLTTSAVQDSSWGATAGRTLLVDPLCLLSYYFLAYRVIGRRWLLAPVAALLFFRYGASLTFVRFIFWPLLLVLLWLVLERRSSRLAAALGAAVVIQAVISPETAYCVPAIGIAIFAADVYATGWRRSAMRLSAFTTTLWTVLGAVLVGVVFLAVLLSQHALADFINYYTAFVPGHILSGGAPHVPLTVLDVEEAVLPIVAMLAALVLVVAKLWLRLRLTTLNWMLVAAAILEGLYYPKFLDRADEPHIWEVFATGVPLFILLVASLVEVAPRSPRRRTPGTALRRGPAAVAFVAVLVAFVVVTAGRAVAAAPDHYRVTVASEPAIAAVGYASPYALDPSSMASDMGILLHTYLPSGGHVFDFTNEPGLLYYVLDFHPSTAYYNVSIAIRDIIQQDLIAQLRTDQPLFVVYAQIETGLPKWGDVPNMVRHYDVSRYLLAHYRPFADVDGQTIYVIDTARLADPASLNLPLSKPLVTTDLPFRGYDCDWGYSPNFLSGSPAPPQRGASASSASLTRENQTSILLTPPAGHLWSDYQWIEIDAASSFTTSTMTLADQPNSAGERHAITFATSPNSPSAYRFPIGACSQWRGYGSAPLHLGMTTRQDIGTIRLIP